MIHDLLLSLFLLILLEIEELNQIYFLIQLQLLALFS